MAPLSIDFTKDYLVTLLAGPEQKAFEVTSKILLRSGHLRDRLKTWLGTENIIISIPEAEADVMQSYLAFIVQGPHELTLSEKTPNAISLRYIELARIYVLANKLCDMGTKNAIPIAMLVLSNVKDTTGKTYPPNVGVVQKIYDNTQALSPMRKLMVDLWIPIDKSLMQSCRLLPDEFMRDLLRAMADPTLLDSKGLKNVLVAVMGAEEVGNLSNRALDRRASLYIEE